MVRSLADIAASQQQTKNWRFPYMMEGVVRGVEVLNDILSVIDSVVVNCYGTWSKDGDPNNIQSEGKQNGYCTVQKSPSPSGEWANFPNGSLLIYDEGDDRWIQRVPISGTIFYAGNVQGSETEDGFLAVYDAVSGGWKRLLYKGHVDYTKNTDSISATPTASECENLRSALEDMAERASISGGPYENV